MKYLNERTYSENHEGGASQQEFASALDISPSTLSGIFNARTQPTLAVVNKIHERFPKVNLMWLLYGTGDMYVKAGNGDGNILPSADKSLNNEERTDISASTAEAKSGGGTMLNADEELKGETSDSPIGERIIERVKYIDKPARRITEINVYFDDGTYEVFVPRKS